MTRQQRIEDSTDVETYHLEALLIGHDRSKSLETFSHLVM